MKRLTLSALVLVILSLGLSACGGDTPTATPVPTNTTAPAADANTGSTGGAADATPAATPTLPTNGDAHITVQHILIGFKDAIGFRGNPPAKAATRTQDQAKALAEALLKRAQAGEDFDQLVKDNTDDQAPGIYSMANNGAALGVGEMSRGDMVAAFGNVAFGLKVGEIGMTDYDIQSSPFGYHIIKRLEDRPVQTTEGQDQHISVQHILIGFKDAVGFAGRQLPEKAATRTQEEAKALAYDILNKAKSGQNFDDLVKQYTDDQAPGIYGMSNLGVTPAGNEFARNQMVPAFGNVGFTLKVGEIGIADYDPQNSPFGYHIIKRLK